ncbi:hypothetical protein FD724_07120 [Nostoc sp. C057]|uniref:hypothetical protein n=1 Tax=Nostoc sp. C057 TaxID=2576903 RepID=UPI0015C40459|nr:hypothetical protein [Nostoc sp. C057]QLE47798.1 hypothetical protein FD724_06545 [Nostoc sp. C057]QLE47908.1 hypothetical protein FD724_07120 [Nostoc sp. C057]
MLFAVGAISPAKTRSHLIGQQTLDKGDSLPVTAGEGDRFSCLWLDCDRFVITKCDHFPRVYTHI